LTRVESFAFIAGMSKSAALKRAKDAVGGSSGLARLLGVKSQAVSQWKQVPAKRVIDVEKLTQVPRHELRPDLYPPLGIPEHSRDAPFRPEEKRLTRHFSRFWHLRKSHFDSGEEIVAHVRALREEWDRR
jgi:YdaS antitoxin of YdaST toxin-antitoxin system